MPVVFGHYQLHELLGRGGMGEVYRAFDTTRQRTVALKRLSPELANDEAFKSRFRRESLLAARLNEPHIIPIHDFGEIDGHLFIDMRLVEGDDLATVISQYGRLAPATAVDVVGQIAAALDAAHQNGLVHRDVKPSNVLLTGSPTSPFAYLVDFGIARSVSGGTAFTATQGTVGTFAYMAPERLLGEPGDHRVDIYALACVLFEALTGQRPFQGELPAMMYAHVNLPPPRASALNGNVPSALDQVIATGMAKNPDQRYQRASELGRAAGAALAGASVRLTPPARPPVPPPAVPPLPPTEVPTPRIPPQSRPSRWPIIAAAIVIALAVAAVVSVLALRNGGSPHAGPTPTDSSSSVPASDSTSPSTSTVAACEQAHKLAQASVSTQHGDVVTFESCAAAPGADPDGYRLITAYVLATDLPESSGASDYDFVVGPCAVFQLTYSFAKQGTTEILPSFTVDQGEVTMVGSESVPVNLATAGPELSVVPNPGVGQAVYLHNGSYAINDATCQQGGRTPAAVPSSILASATR